MMEYRSRRFHGNERENPNRFEEGWRPFRNDITLTQDGDSDDEVKRCGTYMEVEYPVRHGRGRHWRTASLRALIGIRLRRSDRSKSEHFEYHSGTRRLVDDFTSRRQATNDLD